jgi:imidazolonepropionase-like amidohydrolase
VEAPLVIDGPAIAAAGAGSGAPETFDASGCTVLPGLIDAHVHLCWNADTDWRAVYDRESPSRVMARMAGNAQRMAAAGITTVRDLGAPTALSVDLRDAIADGLIAGPSLLVAGAPITTTGGHCWFLGGEADGEVELRKAVRARVRDGVDWIKIMATGGNMTRGTNTIAAQYALEEMRVVVDEARRLRKRVAAHCHGTAGIRIAVEAGADTIEHCTFSGAGNTIDFDPVIVSEMAARRTVVSPTVSVGYRRWRDDGLHTRRAEVLRSIFASGTPVVMSTDCGIPGVPHDALAGGMEVLAELSGLSPFDALKLATSQAAELLGLTDRGILREGARADVLIVEGDPLTGLGALNRVRAVFAGGRRVR